MQAGYASGRPAEEIGRKALIYCPARSASQQGRGKTNYSKGAPNWTIAFESEQKWINPLIGKLVCRV